MTRRCRVAMGPEGVQEEAGEQRDGEQWLRKAGVEWTEEDPTP